MPDRKDEGSVLEELRRLWVEASAETISDDLRRARELAASAPTRESEAAGEYLKAMLRLERWLHDR